MTVLLAIDCSDRACSLALGASSSGLNNLESVQELYVDEARQHAKQLLPMYRQLISESEYQPEDIDAIAIAAGPGSFTGLRIGFSFAQGLAFALNKPLVLVSSLEAMVVSRLISADLPDGANHVQACFDARMGELYTASFLVEIGIELKQMHQSGVSRQGEDALISINDFDKIKDYSSSVLLGSGFSLDALSNLSALETDSNIGIRAKAVYAIGQRLFIEGKGINALGAEPAYLRRHTAWKTTQQQKKAKK